jgi:hypothetical protein
LISQGLPSAGVGIEVVVRVGERSVAQPPWVRLPVGTSRGVVNRMQKNLADVSVSEKSGRNVCVTR